MVGTSPQRNCCSLSLASLLCTIVAVCSEDDIENQVVFLQIDAPSTFLAEELPGSPGPPAKIIQHDVALDLTQVQSSEPYRQTLKNFMDIQYSAEIVVGGQTLDGILDTGSFELLVFSTNCTTCGSVDRFYNSSESFTHEFHPSNITEMHSFGSGDTWSTLAYEHVEFGPLVVEHQYFWEVTAAALPILNIHNSFQAIVGVGPIASVKKQAWATAGVATVAEAIVSPFSDARAKSLDTGRKHALVMTQQKPVLENLGVNIFSTCFMRGQGEPGYFIWNDADPRQDSNFRRISVIGQVHWGVKLDNVEFEGGKSESRINLACGDEQGCAAIVDSGTSVIALPTSVSKRAYELLNELENVSCDDISEFPNLDFELDGKKFSLPPQAYIMEVVGELPSGPFRWIPLPKIKVCTLGFISMDMMSNYGPIWIVGMPFFREYYTTFHLGDDPWNSSNRSLYTATSGDDCHPIESRSSLIQYKQHIKPRRVDLSRLVIPLWLREAAMKGYMML